ncbi:Hydrolase, haloacid dehalogenase-like family [Labilithrix luteola]|uniref:Hydrolase, haloacid dehalogenase-like family n=1 Tax=Labilithrix luteola TaxID=1391654 RepID=A0A0K1PZU3_9BACT|nr:haloacid dehalogenase-like hydrolase [Labilithrix luteola]AKU99012.1 Hydrolase, haloacid dehalogenase-like family [Labilithrix luteola]
MQSAKVDEVLERIERHAEREPGGAIAFDGDGTLWSGDIGEDFFHAFLEGNHTGAGARDALADEAKAHGVDPNGTPTDVARRLHAAYLAGSFPEERICEIMTWVCAGWTGAELDAFASRVVTSIALASRFHEEAHRVVAWARARALSVYLVSASPRAIVEQAAKLVGIELAHVVSATEHRDERGVVQSSVHRPIPYGPGKVTRLREKLGTRTLYAAFGDNAFDVPMLREARVPVAIRPKARLVERAAEVPGIVMLERVSSSMVVG